MDGKNSRDYMKSLGVDFATRQVATMSSLPHPWSGWRHSHHKNAQISFKLGVEFGETTADDGKGKSSVTCWAEANLFTCRSGADKRKTSAGTS